MRAVVYTDNGPSSVLHLEDLPDPTPGPGEVVVRLVRAGVNPTDWKFRAGMMPKAHDRVSPGQDGAGTVEAVGEGVTDVAVGDRVWLRMAQHGRPIGTAAELTVQPADHVAPLPDGASYDLGASLGVPALTAHRALSFATADGRVRPGSLGSRTVLVAGGAGAVGNAAIQLAVWAGATVVTTVSSDAKAALARAAGAHHVLDYTTDDVAARVREVAPDGVDLVVEVAPAQNLDLDLDVVANLGTIAFYANNGGNEATIALRPSFSKNVRIQGILLYTVPPDAMRAGAEDVTAAVAAGALRVGDEAGVPLHHFPLEDTAAAHDAVEAGAVGKVLIDLA
ncbi:NADPH:quinone reductase [Nocardioides rubriscoriae]|uniref:NADPH:quinone reductase n=1 Tax=Nocardioides rubriscoriae TaxID=642762 RepID=UPI0011E051ED|nr:NADPH:quinone reductase [Nocardioides rubriscoriae]